jgi:hemerythrin-like domain-containing protein
MTHRSIEHLLREHREIEAVSAELESLLASQKAQPRWAAEHALAFAWIVRGFTDCVIPHMRKEDELLFPALEGFLPRETGPLAVLRGELRDLRR